MKTEEYLEILTEQICCKKARKAVEEEIRSHIEDQKNAYIEDGMEREEAEAEAVRQMGDPIETGIEMNRIHKPEMAWNIVALAAFLSIAGVIIQFLLNDVAIAYPGKTIGNMLLGLAIMIGVCMLDYSWIGRHAKLFFVIMEFILLLRGVVVCAQYFGISFPHSTILNNADILLELMIPLYGAVLFSYRGGSYRDFVKCLLFALSVICVAPVSSRTSVLTVALSFVVLLTIAIVRGWFIASKKILLSVIWGGFVLMPVLLWHSSTANQKTWIQSFLVPRMPGFGHTPGFISLYEGKIREELSGALWIGKNMKQLDWSILGSNDYTLFYITMQYGILAAILLVVLMVALFAKGLQMSMIQRNQLGMIVGTGCAIDFLIQFILYVLYNMGIMQASAIYCPFISYGGSGMLVTYILLGLMLSVYRYQNVLAEVKAE